MLGRRHQIARLQSDFYRDQFRKMIRRVMAVLVIIFVLVIMILYSLLFQSSSKYYANTVDGQVFLMPRPSPFNGTT
jgi:hypothetical protein